MPIYKKDKTGQLTKLKSFAAKKEKHIQQLVEENLLTVLDMHFLETEYWTTSGGRIDTLAVDTNGAPVIIEYKRNKNDNVINQSLSYLKWLKTQKVEFFEGLVIKKLGAEKAKKLAIDWKNPRIVCIAESYSKYDVDTVEVIQIRVELFKYRYYEDSLFSLEQLGVSEQATKTAQSETPSAEGKNLDKSVETLLTKASPTIKALFEEFRTRIFEIDESIQEKATALYVAYRMTKNFAEIYIGKNQIKLFIRPVDYDDPKGKVDKISEGYNWTLDRRIYLKQEEDLEYVLGILLQSYGDVL